MKSITIEMQLQSCRVIRPAKAGASGKLGPNTVASKAAGFGEVYINVWPRDVKAFKDALAAGGTVQVRVSANSYEKDGETVDSLQLSYVSTAGLDGLVDDSEAAAPALVGDEPAS